MELNLLQTIAVYALPVVFAITLHEAAHGYVAKYFGDLTAHAAGRVSLNFAPHRSDRHRRATLVLLAVSKLFGGGGILFGWAKPVPSILPLTPAQAMLWVAAAEPA